MIKKLSTLLSSERKGKLITFEGIDGSGKSSALLSVMESLEELGIDYTKISIIPEGRIRELVLWDNTFTPAQRMLLYKIEADRAVAKINSALKKDQVVFCERASASTIAYQGYGDELLSEVLTLNSLFEPFPDVDLTLWFDIPVPIALHRLESAREIKDVFEQKHEDFFVRVANGYTEIFRDTKNVLRIDATKSADDVRLLCLNAILGTIIKPIEKLSEPEHHLEVVYKE